MGVKVKTKFYKAAVKKATDEMNFNSLGRAGAFTRQVARRSLRTSKTPSQPGNPPKSPTKLLRNSIRFEVDSTFRDDVVIGPSATTADTIGAVHEFGRDRFGREYPKRPFMEPALEIVRNRLPRFWADKLRS